MELFIQSNKNRIAEFETDFTSKWTFSKYVGIFTSEKIMGIRWPLYVDDNDEEVPISKELSEAARDAFVEYIWEKIDE